MDYILHCENVHPTESNLQIIPIKSPDLLFTEISTITLKILESTRELGQPKQVLNKYDFKLYQIAIETEHQYWRKGKLEDQWNRTEDSDQ